MRSLVLLPLILPVLSPFLFAQQQQPNTVTSSVSTIQSVTGGTATFQIQFLDANLGSTLDSALGVLSATGASAGNLTSMNVSLSQGFVVTEYTFQVPVATSQFTATRDRLIALQRTIANVQTQALAWNTTFSASDEEMNAALEKALPGLLTKARQQAGLLATAMNKTLGDPVALSAPALNITGVGLSITLNATFAVQ